MMGVKKMAFRMLLGQTVLQATSIDALLFLSAILAAWFAMPRIMGLAGKRVNWGFDERRKLAEGYEHQPH